ncbi:unnamed protein product [Camellia sinensis]
MKSSSSLSSSSLSLSSHVVNERNRSEMSSIWSSFRVLAPQWRHNRVQWRHNRGLSLWVLLHSKRNISVSLSSSLNDDSVSPPPNKNQVGYDPSEDLFGLAVDVQPRNIISGAPKPRSWFGPNGQYIKELPCPSCRGRGYTPCTECGIERSRLDCSQCNGKGIKTCHQCSGDCVIWEESIDEQPWEKARSISPFKVKEDDEVDNLDIKLKVRQKTKRVYSSLPPEVGLKISRSLKSLNARTGLFSKRMKIIHRDPMLHAQRVAAIKKTKGTAAARKHASEAMKAFFSDPENRRKRSVSMKGTTEGSSAGYVGKRGITEEPVLSQSQLNHKPRFQGIIVAGYVVRAGIIAGHAHEPLKENHVMPQGKSCDAPKSRTYTCWLCLEKGHNTRTCPIRKLSVEQ